MSEELLQLHRVVRKGFWDISFELSDFNQLLFYSLCWYSEKVHLRKGVPLLVPLILTAVYLSDNVMMHRCPWKLTATLSVSEGKYFRIINSTKCCTCEMGWGMNHTFFLLQISYTTLLNCDGYFRCIKTHSNLLLIYFVPGIGNIEWWNWLTNFRRVL